MLQGATHKLADFEWAVGVTNMGGEGDAGKCFIRLSIATSDGQRKCIELDMKQFETFIKGLETTEKQLKKHYRRRLAAAQISGSRAKVFNIVWGGFGPKSTNATQYKKLPTRPASVAV